MEMQRIPIEKRPDTAPMQFVGDWPGVFIRGDEAMFFARIIEATIQANNHLKNNSILKSLATLLKSCRVVRGRA
jgi:hypothetical protein